MSSPAAFVAPLSVSAASAMSLHDDRLSVRRSVSLSSGENSGDPSSLTQDAITVSTMLSCSLSDWAAPTDMAWMMTSPPHSGTSTTRRRGLRLRICSRVSMRSTPRHDAGDAQRDVQDGGAVDRVGNAELLAERREGQHRPVRQRERVGARGLRIAIRAQSDLCGITCLEKPRERDVAFVAEPLKVLLGR